MIPVSCFEKFAPNFSLVSTVAVTSAQDGGNQGRASARAVGGEHQVELVVDTHQLLDPGLHDVGEVRVVSEDASVDGHHLEIGHKLFFPAKKVFAVSGHLGKRQVGQ